nr:hypothetical protein TetV2_00234 [Oceanusvirus sp.]
MVYDGGPFRGTKFQGLEQMAGIVPFIFCAVGAFRGATDTLQVGAGVMLTALCVLLMGGMIGRRGLEGPAAVGESAGAEASAAAAAGA